MNSQCLCIQMLQVYFFLLVKKLYLACALLGKAPTRNRNSSNTQDHVLYHLCHLKRIPNIQWSKYIRYYRNYWKHHEAPMRQPCRLKWVYREWFEGVKETFESDPNKRWIDAERLYTYNMFRSFWWKQQWEPSIFQDKSKINTSTKVPVMSQI